MFISDAFAAGPVGQGSSLLTFLPFLLIIVVMYFFMIRPQQKRAAAHKTMIEGLKKGDKVVTVGGIVGCINKVSENDFVVEISKDVFISVLKNSISGKYNGDVCLSDSCQNVVNKKNNKNSKKQSNDK